jgi:hypothetical protein
VPKSGHDGRVSDFTVMLQQIETGDAQAANRLLPLVYAELRQLASKKWRGSIPVRRCRPPR